MNFAQESFSWKLVEEIKPLLVDHHEEVPGVNAPLDPDFLVYATCEKIGVLRIFTVRDDLKLVGYQIFMVSKHPHSKDSLQANQDILYLSPDSRKGLLGYRFIKWCASQLINEGVKVVHQHISAKNNFGRILERIGFHLEDLTYSMEVA